MKLAMQIWTYYEILFVSKQLQNTVFPRVKIDKINIGKINSITSLEKPFRFHELEAFEDVKVVSPTHRWLLNTPGDIPGTHFCYRLSQTQGHNAAGRTKPMKNPNDPIGIRTHDLPACSVAQRFNQQHHPLSQNHCRHISNKFFK
jgi:hypothetical protein